MTAREIDEKLDEILAFATKTLSESSELRDRVEALQLAIEDMRERLTYREHVLVGWQEIADRLGVEVRTAQVMADEVFDPLPVLREGGRVVAYATAIDAHRNRRRCPRMTEKRRVMRLVLAQSDENPS